ncbi:pantothenate kinase [Striga asiatica]|uniref:Pantothenate kinase n=1 Tax=Striga asiatica TaxID=4170 RepID=A0A5A7Q053_STRAF|nr:pantothenate kinase [Striga asiatica]
MLSILDFVCRTTLSYTLKLDIFDRIYRRIRNSWGLGSKSYIIAPMNRLTEDHQEPKSIGNDGHINTDHPEEKSHQDSGSVVGRKGSGEKEMAPMAGSSIHRSSSRPQLDLSGAAIQGNFEEKDPTILLPNQSDDISHLALDIGALFLFERVGSSQFSKTRSLIKLVYFSRHENQSANDRRRKIIEARLGMESRIWQSEVSNTENTVIKATGGGAHKFADLFKERLGISIEKEDEMNCLVAGANFLLKAIRHEAFTHMEGQKEFVQIDSNDLFPYLLVNIGSGVSIIKVDGDGEFQRVSGTNVGGGTYWGLGRLLTKCKRMPQIGLSASTIASSFGKAISENKELEDYRPEDISLSLLRMISYNIGQANILLKCIAVWTQAYILWRIFHQRSRIHYGHNLICCPLLAQAMFLRHEGFLGAIGAFMSYEKHGLDDLMVHQFVERFPMGAPYIGGNVHGPPLGDLNEKISWMEKFVLKGTEITAPVPMAPPGTTGLGGFEVPSSKGDTLRPDASKLNVGVLHLVPSLEVFPLLADPKTYEPNTIDLSDHGELEYWFTVLSGHMPDLVDKAVASEGGTDDAKRRGDAFARAFSAHLARENEASLAVLPDLLMEIDRMDEETRLLTLIEGVLAANIFDWGSRACVDLYHKGTIIEIYRMSRDKMQRPWRVDDFDVFKERIFGSTEKKPHRYNRALLFVDNSGADIVLGMLPLARELLRRGTEVVLVANSLPALNDITAMELPDIVAEAAKHCDILRGAAEAGGLLVDAMINNLDSPRARSIYVPLMVVENGCGSPCIDLRQVSSELAAAAKNADLVILEGMGRALHTNYNAKFKCDALKLAMVKNQRLAAKLINGNIYDCVCRFEPAA